MVEDEDQTGGCKLVNVYLYSEGIGQEGRQGIEIVPPIYKWKIVWIVGR